MTPKELEILKALSCTDVETFFPAGGSAAEAQAFDDLVDWLQGLGWIELKVAEQAAHVGMYRRKYIAAVARCTDHGRQLERMLGE